MTIANNKLQVLSNEVIVSNVTTGEWEPTGSTGAGPNAIRCIMKEGGFVEFARPESAVHLYWPATSQTRDAKAFKTRQAGHFVGKTPSQVSVFLGTGSAFLSTEPPKSEAWQVSHTFASNIVGLDIEGPCVISAQAESLGVFM